MAYRKDLVNQNQFRKWLQMTFETCYEYVEDSLKPGEYLTIEIMTIEHFKLEIDQEKLTFE